MIILISLIITLVINFALFLVAFRNQSDKLTDFSYTLSFIIVAVTAFVLSPHKTPAAIIAVGLVLLWALRLGIFLVIRVRRTGKDTRFDDIRGNFFAFLRFWVGQGLVAWILLLPLLFLLTTDYQASRLFYVGMLVWLLGFTIESIADYQKFRFTANHTNKNKWIDTGLWYYSRHPNYFGEITVWVGMYLLTFAALSPVECIVALLSPISITVTLLLISGVPILEKNADKRWGSIKAYRDYKKSTSILVPLPRLQK